MKKIRLIEINSEIGAGTRGSSLGIGAMKVAAWNAENDFFKKYDTTVLPDENHLLYEEDETSPAKRIGGIIKVYERLSNAVYSAIEEDSCFPIVLAGDHASIGGSIAGVKMAHPDKRIGVVWVDAHGDLHSPFTTPSGNMHGMPLAATSNLDNLAFQQNEVDSEIQEGWNRLKELGNFVPKVLPEDIVFFGARDLEKPEISLIQQKDMRNFTVEEVRREGIDVCVQKALKKLEECDVIYLSFDVDSMDCDLVSMGTGTPVKNGFEPEEAEAILHGIVSGGKVVCFDVVEVNPTLDNKGNKMAETAFSILASTSQIIEGQLKESETPAS